MKKFFLSALLLLGGCGNEWLASWLPTKIGPGAVRLRPMPEVVNFVTPGYAVECRARWGEDKRYTEMWRCEKGDVSPVRGQLLYSDLVEAEYKHWRWDWPLADLQPAKQEVVDAGMHPSWNDAEELVPFVRLQVTF